MHSLLFIPWAENGGWEVTAVGHNRQKRNFPSSPGLVPTAQDREQPRFSVTEGLWPFLPSARVQARAGQCAQSAPAAGFLPGIRAESTGCLWPGLQRREGGAEGSSGPALRLREPFAPWGRLPCPRPESDSPGARLRPPGHLCLGGRPRLSHQRSLHGSGGQCASSTRKVV